MMEMQWGGGTEGAVCFDIFRDKIAGVFLWCAIRLAQQATIRPTRGRLAEGYGLHVSPSEAVSLQD